MEYQKIYDLLMEDRLSKKTERKIEKDSGVYFERHHIVPMSLGGDKSYAIGSPNIVLLTAREHYIAHRMLWLIHKTREMGFAFHKMVFSQSPLQERRFDSRAYESAKKAFSECQRGENNPMWGKTSWMKGKVPANKGKKTGPRPDLVGDNNPSRREDVRKKISGANKGNPKLGIRGSDSSNFGGYKILLKDGQFIGRFENLVDILELVPCSIHNLKNHIKKGKGGIIKGGWQVFYEKDYKKSLG
jgi:hypothetical protein